VVVGELVPKQLALRNPELIAARVARPMHGLARAAGPLVRVLSASSAGLLRLAGAGPRAGAPVTDEEIVVLMRQGARAGVFEKTEPALVSNILHLDEQPVGAIMTPRLDMFYLDLDDGFETNRRKIIASPDWIIPVCRGGSEEVVGMLHTHDLLGRCLAGEPVDIGAALRAPFIIPPTLSVLEVLEGFRTHRVEVALVADEYGHLLGLVSLTHVLEAIVGELPAHGEDEPGATRRDDGSWLLDGAIDLHRFRQLLEVGDLPGEESGDFHTLGGFVMAQLGRVPRPGDAFRWKDLRLEVVDMDRNRVDKVLVSRPEHAAAAAG
jgi:magnesium and cobalt exporter, CNNM family